MYSRQPATVSQIHLLLTNRRLEGPSGRLVISGWSNVNKEKLLRTNERKYFVHFNSSLGPCNNDTMNKGSVRVFLTTNIFSDIGVYSFSQVCVV